MLGGEADPQGGQGAAEDLSQSLQGHQWEDVSPQGMAFIQSRGWIRCGHVKVMLETTLNHKDKIVSVSIH